MKKLLFCIFCFVLGVSTFAQKKYTVAQDTPFVKIIQNPNPNASKITPKSVVTMLIRQYLDTLLIRDSGQQMFYPSQLGNEFLNMKEGDNIFLVVPVSQLTRDSMQYKNFITQLQILKVYNDSSKINSPIFIDVVNEEDLKIKRFLKDRDIQATKLPNGTYLEILEKGNGNPVGDKPMQIKVRYRGILMDNGVVFHQNMKPNQAPLIYNTDKYEFLPVCEEILKTMNKGEHVRLYIPSSQAFGKRFIPNIIPPYSNLVYEFVLEDIEPILKLNNKKK